MAFRQIKTIEDMEKLYYSRAGARFIQKADAPILTTTSGFYNAVYGAQVWNQLNQESNLFGLLPKVPWGKSGWRIITANAGSDNTGGVAENGGLPETIKPTVVEVSTKPKTIAHNFHVSEVQDFLAGESADDYFGSMEQMRPIIALRHKEQMNIMLGYDYDTLASNNLESLDRVCASESERSGLSYTAGDQDMYGIDRSASTIYDAYVSHASGTDRVLTDGMLRTALNTIKTNGGHTTAVVTGNDTMTSIQGLFEGGVRYHTLGEATVRLGVNGIQTADGFPVGLKVSSLYTFPLLTSVDVAQDTLSRIMFLDTSDPEGFGVPRLGIGIAKPTQYFEAGMKTGNPFSIDALGNEGMFRTMGELLCRNFKAQGKIRDLK